MLAMTPPTRLPRGRIRSKGRCILPGCKPSQRVGKINITKPFDAVLLVLLDKDFDVTHIYEADRAHVI